MPSPFPGMNPYLEQKEIWQDFHDRYVPAIGDALAAQVSPHFIVKIEEHRFIHEPSAEKRRQIGRADVSLRPASPSKRGEFGAGSMLAEAPCQLVLSTDFEVERYEFIEIYDRKNRELVAALEVLSPANKDPGGDRQQYLVKRQGILRSTAHFIEIDLLRGGPKMPTEGSGECDYSVLISVYEGRPQAGYWPIMLRDRLPIIPIPLREPLNDVRLDLQEILHTVYDRAYYKDHIYQGTPEPPLSAEDATWAESLLATSEKNNP